MYFWYHHLTMCDGLMVVTMISHGFRYLTYNKCWRL